MDQQVLELILDRLEDVKQTCVTEVRDMRKELRDHMEVEQEQFKLLADHDSTIKVHDARLAMHKSILATAWAGIVAVGGWVIGR